MHRICKTAGRRILCFVLVFSLSLGSMKKEEVPAVAGVDDVIMVGLTAACMIAIAAHGNSYAPNLDVMGIVREFQKDIKRAVQVLNAHQSTTDVLEDKIWYALLKEGSVAGHYTMEQVQAARNWLEKVGGIDGIESDFDAAKNLPGAFINMANLYIDDLESYETLDMQVVDGTTIDSSYVVSDFGGAVPCVSYAAMDPVLQDYIASVYPDYVNATWFRVVYNNIAFYYCPYGFDLILLNDIHAIGMTTNSLCTSSYLSIGNNDFSRLLTSFFSGFMTYSQMTENMLTYSDNPFIRKEFPCFYVDMVQGLPESTYYNCYWDGFIGAADSASALGKGCVYRFASYYRFDLTADNFLIINPGVTSNLVRISGTTAVDAAVEIYGKEQVYDIDDWISGSPALDIDLDDTADVVLPDTVIDIVNDVIGEKTTSIEESIERLSGEIADVVPGIDTITEGIDDTNSLLDDILDGLKKLPGKIVGAFGSLWDLLFGWLKNIVDLLKLILDGILSIPGVIGDILSWLKNSLSLFLGKILDGILAIPGAIGDLLQSLFVPDPEILGDIFYTINNRLEEKLSYKQYVDFMEALKEVSASRLTNITMNWHGRTVTVLSFDWYYDNIDFINNLIRGVTFIALIFFNVNQVYRLLRNTSLYKIEGYASEVKK